ncbi:hypothetical protein F5884DRAFT_821561 [Xylogone sp. PMI_703]|nr:hypothetical protein F5884DRAFT_821561 [Xylogone sp. PMI_703]
MAAPARRGITHQFLDQHKDKFPHRLVAFEHTPNESTKTPKNILLFIGGLFDGLLTIPYPSKISDALPADWTLAEVILSSSYSGWGTASLAQDARQISQCVQYFRTIKSGKIVIMGHSTGCQDVMEYLTGPGHEKRASVDGALIQAPASDREAMEMLLDPKILKESCLVAQAMVASGHGEEILPSRETASFFPAPVCARRWLSLASPNHDGEDDYFSSDLTDEQLMKSFGSLPAGSPLCILYSGNDEYVPKWIDKNKLIQRWIDISKKGNGKVDEKYTGVMEGATHNLDGNPDEVVHGLVNRVVGFLSEL